MTIDKPLPEAEHARQMREESHIRAQTMQVESLARYAEWTKRDSLYYPQHFTDAAIERLRLAKIDLETALDQLTDEAPK